MKNRAVVIGVVLAVLVIWLVGTAVTKYSLEQMASTATTTPITTARFFTP